MNPAYSEPRYANYTRSIFMAQKALEEAGIKTFPVSLRVLLRHYHVFMVSYETYCRENHKTMEECFRVFGKDAATIDVGDGTYIIVYNKEVSPPARKQFTMAHELGHIVLRHHQELGDNTIRRMWIEKPLYEVLEDEANCFARNLLSPPGAAMELLRMNGFTEMKYDAVQKRNVWFRTAEIRDYMDDYSFLQQAFMITPTAAKTRCHFLHDDLMNLRPQQKKNPPRIKFTSKWRCARCGAERVDEKAICYFCGTRGRYQYRSKEDAPAPLISFSYDGFHYKRCFFCGNSSFDRDDLFCSVCGKPASNPCVPFLSANTDIPSVIKKARHRCPPNARYCPDCGAETLYSRLHYPFPDQEAPEMNYGPAIPHAEFSPETIPDYLGMNQELRLRKCTYCGRAKHDKDALFCTMCGMPIVNICPECAERNPAIARFCKRCGHKTTFFERQIIPPFGEEMKDPIEYHQPPNPPEGEYTKIKRQEEERMARKRR